MDMQSVLVLILLPLMVLATAITFLLMQRARRKKDQAQ
jgi:preprotein translocase subunit YajC